MISLTTAKLLLFIALLAGPKIGGSNLSIEIVNKTSYCVWEQDTSGWSLTQLGQVVDHWPENGTNPSFELQRSHNADFVTASEVSKHHWKAGEDSKLYLSNGDIVEKQGNKIFYTTNPGAFNQEIYTILTLKDGQAL